MAHPTAIWIRGARSTKNVAAPVRGRDFFPYRPYHLGPSPARTALARIANAVQRILATGKYAGAVWTQGSPRIEEALYWLNVLVDTRLPTCGNAAQRPHGHVSNDGDKNIVDSVEYIVSRVWADEAGRNRAGVVLVQDQQVFAARDVQKADARPGGYVTTGGHGGILGAAGWEGPARLTYVPATRHTYCSAVNITRLRASAGGAVHRRTESDIDEGTAAPHGLPDEARKPARCDRSRSADGRRGRGRAEEDPRLSGRLRHALTRDVDLPDPSRRDRGQCRAHRPAPREPALGARRRPGRAAGPSPRARGHRADRVERSRARRDHRHTPSRRHPRSPRLRPAPPGAELRRRPRHILRRPRVRPLRAGLRAAERRDVAGVSRARRSRVGTHSGAGGGGPRSPRRRDARPGVPIARRAPPRPPRRRGGAAPLGEHVADDRRRPGALARAPAQLHRPPRRPGRPPPQRLRNRLTAGTR